MLECLNIDAWPVIVKSTGLDERLINTFSIGNFDHCVIEFVFEGDTLLFDSTRELQRGKLDQKYVSDFKYGLRLIKGNKHLTPLERNIDQKVVISGLIHKKNEEFQHKIDWEINFWGDIANRYTAIYQDYGINSLRKNMNDNFTYDWLIHDNPGKYSFSEDLPYSKLDIGAPSSHVPMLTFDNGGIDFFPNPFISFCQYFNFIEHKKMAKYISLPADYENVSANIKLLEFDVTHFEPDTFHFENDWVKFHKRTWLQKDTVFADYELQVLKTHLRSSRKKEISQDIEQLQEGMRLVIKKEINAENVFSQKIESSVEPVSDFSSRIILGLLVSLGLALLFIVWKIF